MKFTAFLYLSNCQQAVFIQQQANTLREGGKIRESWRIENSAAVSPWIIYLGVPSLHAWHGNKRGCRPSSQPWLTTYDRLSGKLQIHYGLTGKAQETSMMPLSGRALHLLKGWIIPIRAPWWNALLGLLYVLFSIFTSSCSSDFTRTWSMSLSLEGRFSWDHHSGPFKLSCLSYIAHLSAGDEG